MSAPRRVLVSGGGIAGAGAAHWLARTGAEVTLVERAPALRTGGYKVDVRGAAVEVLRRMGLLVAAHEASAGMQRLTWADPGGRPLARVAADEVMGRRGDDVELFRTDLVRILHGALADDVDVVLGQSVTGLGEHGEVELSGGRQERFDLVVGADGLRSTVRVLARGEVPLRHLGASVAFWTTPNLLRLDHEELTCVLPGLVFFAYGTGPDEPAGAGMFFRGPADGSARPTRADVLAAAAPLTGDLAALVEAMGDDAFVDSVSQVDPPCFGSARVALVGDAAACPSPASGQGTSLALVGAHQLGRAVGEVGDVDAAVRAYASRMRPFAVANLALGRRLARDVMPRSRLGAAAQLVAVRHLPRPALRLLVSRTLSAPVQRAAGAIDLDTPMSDAG